MSETIPQLNQLPILGTMLSQPLGVSPKFRGARSFGPCTVEHPSTVGFGTSQAVFGVHAYLDVRRVGRRGT